MSTSHPRIPVRLPTWEELNRRVSQLSEYLLNLVPTQVIAYGLNQQAYTTGAGSPSVPITGFAGSVETEYATSNDGIITVQEEALYEITALVVFTGGEINDSYGLEFIITHSTGPVYQVVAITEWTNKTTAGALNGTLIVYLQKGDTVAMGIIESVTADVIQLETGQLSIEQVT